MIDVSERMKGESAKDYVLRLLIDNIVSCTLIPGEKIYDEDMCSLLGVSRTPFREAVLELSNRKLIEIHPKRGTYISLIDTSLVEEVRHLRAILESEIAALACERISDEDKAYLYENLALWKLYMEKRNEKKILFYDKAFHSRLYRACGFSFWDELVLSSSPHFDRTTILSLRVRPTAWILSDHETLLKAIEHKDKALASDIAFHHLDRYLENIGMIMKAYPEYFRKD